MTISSTNTTTTPVGGAGPTGPSPSSGQGSAPDSKADQVKQAASVAQDEAKQLASDVREQARGLMNETRTQVEDQSRTQRDRLVEIIRTFSDDLDGMAEQGGGLASDAAREVATRARSISQQLDGREPAELLDDLRSFARRRPGLFLAGSVIAGVVVGRMLRGAREAAQTGTGSPHGTTTARTSASGYPAVDPEPVMAAEPEPAGADPLYDPIVPTDAPPLSDRQVP